MSDIMWTGRVEIKKYFKNKKVTKTIRHRFNEKESWIEYAMKNILSMYIYIALSCIGARKDTVVLRIREICVYLP